MHNPAQYFEELVALKYQLFNALFLSLPFEGVRGTGILLPLLKQECENGLKNQKTPIETISHFFDEHTNFKNEKEEIDFLFRIIQYVERQIVLVDALEEAAYSKIHPRQEVNSFTHLASKALKQGDSLFSENLLQQFGVRVVLTAHPTQFYPSSVLAIITDLTTALQKNDNNEVKELLHQLGKTPFLQKEKPDPYDEATRLIWYLEQIFYSAIGQILSEINEMQDSANFDLSNLIRVGFWPGGDRDGNPYVTTETTLKVAEKLRTSILYMYLQDLRKLRRRLSFEGIYEQIHSLEIAIKKELAKAGTGISLDKFKQNILDLHKELIDKHQGLFADRCFQFYQKIEAFAYHFASLDIRQDSRIIASTLEAVVQKYPNIFPKNLFELSETEQIDTLVKLDKTIDINDFSERIIYDTLASLAIIKDIQNQNGEYGAHRYIISNCRGAIDVIKLWALLGLVGWKKDRTVDIVPLFETIDDLKWAGKSMNQLYKIEEYRQHLGNRMNKQTVMLGFSDGTKDGGYLMANWSIYLAKKDISMVSAEFKVNVMFFDGRGGPPARGGGSAYAFYSDLGKHIHSKEIQMTVQGQTISSHYGTQDSAILNMELLLMAGLQNNLRKAEENSGLSVEQQELLTELSNSAYGAYSELKEHPQFLSYLEHRSTLLYYGKANIGSRPSKRSMSEKLSLDDLRAIPFVGAWSQLKQNVPGFYGVGEALLKQKQAGNFDACKKLYLQSLFFKALIDNSMQSMSKTNFELTRYMSQDAEYGDFWNKLHNEFLLSKSLVLELTGKKMLLADTPVSRMSIALREKIVLPLLTIQQYALIKIQKQKSAGTNEYLKEYEKIVIRSLFGNINAARNSA